MTDQEEAQQDKRTFFAKDIHQMNLVLGKFLQKSGAETVLLVDEAGHLVARQGVHSPASEDTITALVAGTFVASHALASMLGAHEFSSLIPRGGGGNLMLLRAGERALLAVIFGNETPISLVRTYALDTVRRVAAILGGDEAIHGDDEKIEPAEFDGGIDDALTDVFG